MGRLQDGPYRYREDLGGLCNICSEYFQKKILHKIELVKRHLKRDYEHEFTVNQQGKINHNNCVDHFLPYAFGTCTDVYTSRCENCANFYNFSKIFLHK